MYHHRFQGPGQALSLSSMLLLFITLGCSGPQPSSTETAAEESPAQTETAPAAQAETAPAEGCPDNLLKSASALYPDGVPQGGILRLKGDMPMGFAPLHYEYLFLPHLYDLVQLPLTEWRQQHYRSRLADCAYLDPDTNAVIVRLKQDVAWHPLPAGDSDSPPLHLTASDLEFTANLYSKNWRTGVVPSRGRWSGVTAEARDELTVSFAVPAGRSEWDLVRRLIPLPEWYYGLDADGQPIPIERLNAKRLPREALPGNGPYRVASADEPGKLILQRFDSYHGEAPTFDTITFLGGFDHLDLRTQLETEVYDIREVDTGELVENEVLVDPQTFDTSPGPDGSTEQGRLGVAPVSSEATVIISWNLDHPIFGDPAPRKAIAHLLDREALVNGPLKNAGVPSYGLIGRDDEFFDDEFEPYPFSPETAQRILVENGWQDTDKDGILDRDGVPLTLQLEVAPPEVWLIPVLQQFSAEAAEIGVQVEFVKLSFDESWKPINKAAGRLAEYAGFGWSTVLLMHSQLSYRHPIFSVSPELDALADAVNSAREAKKNPKAENSQLENSHLEHVDNENEELEQQVQLAQQVIHEKQYLTPVFAGLNALVWNPGLRHHEDFNYQTDGLDPLQWYWLEPPDARPELPERQHKAPRLPEPPNQVQRLPIPEETRPERTTARRVTQPETSSSR